MKTNAILRAEQATRLRDARAAAGFKTAADAVEKYRWKTSTYLANENGQNGLTVESAKRYAAAYDVESGWLLTGEGRGPGAPTPMPDPPAVETNSRPAPMPPMAQAEMPKDLPVLGIVQGGPDGTFFFDNDGTPIDYVRRPPRLAGIRDAYALYVQGDSMEPWRERGQLVMVAPRIPVQNGDYVAVQLRDHEHAKGGLVKRLVKRNQKEVQLEQFNPPKILKFPADQIVCIHRIMEWTELMGV